MADAHLLGQHELVALLGEVLRGVGQQAHGPLQQRARLLQHQAVAPRQAGGNARAAEVELVRGWLELVQRGDQRAQPLRSLCRDQYLMRLWAVNVEKCERVSERETVGNCDIDCPRVSIRDLLAMAEASQAVCDLQQQRLDAVGVHRKTAPCRLHSLQQSACGTDTREKRIGSYSEVCT